MNPPSAAAPATFVRFGVLFYGAMGIAAVLWRVGGYGESIWRPTAAEPALGPWAALLWGAAVGLVVVAGSWLFTERSAAGARLARAMAEPLRGLSVPDALLLAAASGFAEELFFRGALQPRVGLVVASVLFGALHFAPRRELWPWTLFAVVMGFVLGGLYERTGSLLAPVAAHTVVNGINLPLLVRRYAGDAGAAAASDDSGGG